MKMRKNEPGMSAGINEIENRRGGNETSKRPPRRGVPLRCSRVGSGGAPVGWAWNGRAVKALPYGAADETKKSRLAKRTWNVRSNQRDRKSEVGDRDEQT